MGKCKKETIEYELAAEQSFADALSQALNYTTTENGAKTLRSSGSSCLDLFATVGALRQADERELIIRFVRAWAENKDLAVKILFYARDIRGGLGERKVFRTIMSYLGNNEPETVRKNLDFVAEFGRWDDLLVLFGTKCEADALAVISAQLEKDKAALQSKGEVSLLGKWLPSVNASNAQARKNAMIVANYLGMNSAEYRKLLSALRAQIKIIENNLREKDYSFDYSKQPSRALFKYRQAFYRNDAERYSEFLRSVSDGETVLKTGGLMPYEIISPVIRSTFELTKENEQSINATWNALENFPGDESALVVVDGSGSMYWNYGTSPLPIEVSISLGMYFAERNKGVFANRFMTFSHNPQLIEIKGETIVDKVRYCMSYNECANTNIQKVFDTILSVAVSNNVPQRELPSKIIIVSDMEFDSCTDNAGVTNFQYAKKQFKDHGYKLPQLVFWNVSSGNNQQPVGKNDRGVALVSGCTARTFSMVAGDIIDPYALMLEVLNNDRYSKICA